MIDVDTRWLELYPYSDKQSNTISLIFDREGLCRYPRPRVVIFNNGTEFSSEIHELFLSYGITPRQTTIKNPQVNSFIERTHLVIANALRAMDLHKRPYDQGSDHAILQSVAWGLRSTFHYTLNSTPDQLTFGRYMITNANYIANWHNIRDRSLRSTLRNNTKENKMRTSHTHVSGSQVFVSTTDITHTLNFKAGPFKVIEVHTNGTVTIYRSANITERINIRHNHPLC